MIRADGRSEVVATSRRSAGTHIIGALICTIVVLAIVAVAMGQTDSWDLRNYHLYDGWAFWTGRGWHDWAAAQTQTYFNPLLATATYLLFMHTPPWLSTFALGALQGANILPLYVIAHDLLPDSPQPRNRYLALLVAIASVAGATQLSELGTSIGDNLVSLPLLCAFAVAFNTTRLNARRATAVGLLLGVAVGIKLTTAVFALGLAIALPVLVARDKNPRWRNLGVAYAAAACAFVVTDGFWMLRLWHEFGNPLHPMFGDWFGGNFAPPFELRDQRFLPRNLVQWLFYPLVWAHSPRLVSETWFLDLRIPLAFIALPLLLFSPSRGDERDPRIRTLALALSLAYVAWLIEFGIYRYLAPLEMLSPLLIVLAIERIAGRYAWRVAVGVLVVVLLTTRPFTLLRLPEYGPRFLEIELPAVPDLAHADVVLAEDEPLAFLALGFPPTTTFIRIGGNLMGLPIPAYGMDREAGRRLSSAKTLYALVADPHSQRMLAAFARQGLRLVLPCHDVRSNLLGPRHRAHLCTVRRIPIDTSTGSLLHNASGRKTETATDKALMGNLHENRGQVGETKNRIT